MVAGNNKKTEEPKIAAPIGIDKKVFGSGEDPQFNVGELSAPKKIEVALANVASAVGKKDTKEITETGAVLIAPDGKKNTDAVSVRGGEVKIDHTKVANFRPGVYRVEVDSVQNGEKVTQEKEFAWGVLTANTDKSIYLPGDSAYIQMAALDDNGHTLCGADLKLEIIDPQGYTATQEIKRSETCSPESVTDKPDYFVHYEIANSGQGKYTIRLTNNQNGFVAENYFEVRDSVPFAVQRSGATRINPFAADYTMSFNIKANQDFSGTITETVPKDFEITKAGNANITNNDSGQQINWNVNLTSGQQITLKYTYKAPQISPQLFLLGPLQFNQNNAVIFAETHQWQIASDASCVWTGTSSTAWATNGNWSTCSGSGNAGPPASGDSVSIGSTTNQPSITTAVTIASLTLASDTLTLNTGASLTVSGNITLNSGTFNSNGFAVSMSGDYVNNGGQFTAGSSAITIAGTATQSIAGFSTTGLVTMTKTAGTATLQGNMSCVGITINGNGGTLNLGTGLSHATSAAVTLTNGTLNGGSSTLTVTSGNWINNIGAAYFAYSSSTVVFNDQANAQSVTGSFYTNFYNITVDKASQTLSVGGTFTSAGTLTVTSGTFSTGSLSYFANVILNGGSYTPGGYITITGDWTNNGCTFTPGNNTITFNGTGDQNINGSAASSFYALTVNKASGILHVGTSVLNLTYGSGGNAFTLTAGTFDAGSATINVTGGRWYVATGTTFTVGTSTVNFTSTTDDQYLIGGAATYSFFNLGINKSGKTFYPCNITPTTLNVNGSLTLTAGTFSPNGLTTLTVTGTTTISNGSFNAPATTNLASLVLNGGAYIANTNTNVTGDWTVATGATFAPGSNTVTFTSTSADQNINGTAASQTFYNLTVNKTGYTLHVASATTTLTISHTMTISAGTFDAGTAATINMTGGDWTNNGGTFTPGSGTVVFNYAGANQNVNGTATTQTFNNITTDKTSKTLSVNTVTTLNINGNLTLASGSFTMGTTINIAGNWTNNGVGIGCPSCVAVFNSTTADQYINGSQASQSIPNITVNKSGKTLYIGGSTTTLSISNTMTLTAGTFDAGTAATINMTGGLAGGGWTNNGGTFIPGSSTMVFNGTSYDQNINGTAGTQTFNAITVAKNSKSLIVGGNTTTLNIGGLFTLTSGTFNAGTATTINKTAGDWTVASGATFTPGSSTVVFNNTSGAQAINGTISSQTFNGITVNKPGLALTVGGSTTNLSLNGAFTLTSGIFTAPVNMTAGSVTNNGTLTAGNSSFTVNGTVILNGGTFALTGVGISVAGDWTNNGGTFTPNGYAVTFNGTGDQNINGTANVQNFYILTVNKASGTLYLGNSLTLNLSGMSLSNSFTLTAGTFNAGTNTTINMTSGNWSEASGTTVVPGSSTVVFNDTSYSQTITGTAGTQTFNNITVNKSSQTLSTAGSLTTLTLNGTLTMTSGVFTAPATVNVVNVVLNGGIYVTGTTANVSGNWTNNGGVVGGSAGNLVGNTNNNGCSGPSTDTVYMARFQASSTGTLKNLQVLYSGGTGKKYKMAIYSDSGASPGALLAASGDMVATSSMPPATIPDVAITSGTYYWIAIAVEGNWCIQNYNSGGTVKSDSTITLYGYNFPNPAGTISGSGSQQLDLVGYGVTPPTGTVIFNSTTADQNINGSAASQTFNSITVNKSGYALNVNGSTTALTLSGTLTMTAGNFTAPSTMTAAAITVNSGTLTAGSSLTSSGTITLAGGTLAAGTNIYANGDWTNNGGTFTPGSGTVAFGASGGQNINGSAATHTFNNLTLSGSGNKTFAAPAAVGGTLSISGTAKAALSAGDTTSSANVILLSGVNEPSGTWGSTSSSATNKNDTYFAASTGYVTIGTGCSAGNWQGATSADWNDATNWCAGVPTATTDVVINSGGNQPTIGSAGGTSRNLTINSGASLTVSGAYTLTINGNFTNNSGTFTPGSAAIVIAGTAAQSIAGFTTTGTVSMTKTGGTATLQGNVNGAGLTINGSGGTLNLGSGLTHTFTGDVTLTAGTLNGGSSTLNENNVSATAWGGTGSNFTCGSSTVNFGAAGNQTLSASATTFNNLTFSNSGTKTFGSATTINANMVIAASVVVNLGTYTSATLTLNLDGGNQATGSWGSTASSATYKNNTYFGNAATGIVNVSNGCTSGTWVGASGTDWNVSANWCGELVPTAATDVIISSGGNQPSIGSAGGFCHNITIGSGATLTFSGAYNLIVTGDLTNNGGTFTPSAGTITFNNTTGAQAITGTAGTQTFNNITINKSGQTLSVSGSTTTLTLNGMLTLTSGTFAPPATTNLASAVLNGGTYTAGTNTNVSGDWTVNTEATFTPGANTVTFNSTTADQNINGTASNKTFNNFTVNKSGYSLKVGGNTSSLTVSNNLAISAGSFVDGGAQIIGNASGTFTMAAGTNLCLGGSSCTVSSSTATTYPTLFTNGHTTLDAASTITYLSSSNQAVSSTPAYGSLNFAPSTGTPTYTLQAATTVNGNLTIGSRATLSAGASNYNISIGGDWINNGGTFRPGTDTVTFNSTSADQSIRGSAASQTFNNITSNKNGWTLNVGGSTNTLASTGTFTLTVGNFSAPATVNLANLVLTSGTYTAGTNTNITGNWTNNGGTFAANGSTVTFSGAAQTIGGSASTTFNNVATSGSTNTSTGYATTIGDNLAIGDGTTFTAAGYNLTVGGATTVGTGTGGNLTISSATGTKIFTGLVTVAAGGTWTNTSANSAVIFRGGITNSGNFNAGTGTQTFDIGSQNIICNGASISIPSMTVTGITATNKCAGIYPLTVSIALSGSGGLTQDYNANLYIGGTSGIATLTANNSGNTVNYTGAGQTVNNNNYYNLTLSGSGSKTFFAAATIAGALAINGTAQAALAAGANSTTRQLYLGASLEPSGTWGSTLAGKTYVNDTYFASSTGYVTVAAPPNAVRIKGGLKVKGGLKIKF